MQATSRKAVRVERAVPAEGQTAVTFFLGLLYLALEYVRPQAMYPILSGLPLNQIVLAMMMATMVLEGYGFRVSHPLNIALPAYFVAVCLSALFGVSVENSRDALVQLLSWVVIILLLSNVIAERGRFRTTMFLLLLLHLRMSQYSVRNWVLSGFSFNKWGFVGGASFFNNAGDFGVTMAVVIPLGIYYALSVREGERTILPPRLSRLFWWGATVSFVLAIMASTSRGAALAVGISLLAIWAKGKRKGAGAVAVAVLVVLLSGLASTQYMDRFHNTGEEADRTGQDRIHLWKQGLRMAGDYPVLGVGINNYVYYNNTFLDDPNNHEPHNVFIQALSESGLLGLSLLVVILVLAFRSNAQVRRMLRENGRDDPFLLNASHALDVSLIAWMVGGFFLTVLYYPFLWIDLMLVTALHGATVRLSQEGSGVRR